MKKYFIVAESGADLSQEMIEKHDIRVAQMHVEFDGKDHLDSLVSIDELTNYYEKTGRVPKTAGVNPYQYEEIFAKIKEENPEAVIIHICYSAQLSCGYQSSMIADDKTISIFHIDSMNVTIGQGLIVLKAAEMIESEPEIEPEELVAHIRAIAEKTRFSFIPGNLDYLRAGGRVSNAQHLGAKLLKLKPLIQVIEGRMLSTKKYRGSGKEIIHDMLADFFREYAIDKEVAYFVYVRTLDSEIKREVEKHAEEAGIRNVVWHKAGGVITSHSGPGGIGIACLEIGEAE